MSGLIVFLEFPKISENYPNASAAFRSIYFQFELTFRLFSDEFPKILLVLSFLVIISLFLLNIVFLLSAVFRPNSCFTESPMVGFCYYAIMSVYNTGRDECSKIIEDIYAMN